MGIDERDEITSQRSRGRPAVGAASLLRGPGLVAVIVGGAGWEGLMLHAGRHQGSRLLLVLFTGWVLLPFAALVVAYLRSKDWSESVRATLYGAMVAVGLGSLLIYGYVALGPPRVHAAAAFVVVPPVSLLVIGMVLLIAWLRSRSR